MNWESEKDVVLFLPSTKGEIPLVVGANNSNMKLIGIFQFARREWRPCWFADLEDRWFRSWEGEPMEKLISVVVKAMPKVS